MHLRLVFLKMSRAIICNGEERDHCIETTLLSIEGRGNSRIPGSPRIDWYELSSRLLSPSEKTLQRVQKKNYKP